MTFYIVKDSRSSIVTPTAVEGFHHEASLTFPDKHLILVVSTTVLQSGDVG